MNDLELALKFLVKNGPLVTGLNNASTITGKFVNKVKGEFASIGRTWNTTMGKLATVGIGFSALKIAADSAKIDKSLIQVGQTAGATAAQVKSLRNQLFTMAGQTGKAVATLAEGFSGLIASGLSWDQASATIRGINTAMAVTGADARTLANGLTVAATAFQFDLTNPDMALTILDKMTVAGRLGNAELENLSDIFARVGTNAKTAGMSFDKTLAFIETLSMAEKAPERLATLADSTLRLFTNSQYMKAAQKATGVKFFDDKGSRRDAFEVLADIRKKFSQLNTEMERQAFVSKMLKGADLDTIKGMRTLLQGDMLDTGKRFSETIAGASGTLKRDAPDAMRNAVDQAARLKETLGRAGDSLAQPINEALSKLIEWSLNSKADGGLGLSGGQIAGGAAAAGVTAYIAGRLIKNGFGRMLSGGASTIGNIAVGKALQESVGVTPVFVVNWPAGAGLLGGGGMPGLPGGRGLPRLPSPVAGRLPGTVGKVGGALSAGSLMPWLGAALLVNESVMMTNRFIAEDRQLRKSRASDNLSAALRAGGISDEDLRSGTGLQKKLDAVRMMQEAASGIAPSDATGGKTIVNLQVNVDKNGEVVTRNDSPSEADVRAALGFSNRGSF